MLWQSTKNRGLAKSSVQSRPIAWMTKIFNKEQWQTKTRIHWKYSIQRGKQQAPKCKTTSIIFFLINIIVANNIIDSLYTKFK